MSSNNFLPATQLATVGRALWLSVPFVAASAAIAVALYSGTKAAPRLPGGAERSYLPSPRLVELPPPDLLRPLDPAQAQEQNAQRPFSARADLPASPFVLAIAEPERGKAINCLAQAAYYEAAGEGVDGGRAVAQVVLNRVRHPSYPSSVCGVVYQGSERATGCQFTFTCDGSLRRRPVPALWSQSLRIAQEALSGRVYGPVGHATHFHADYVLPYWADSLDKKIQIARHIFYRLHGSLGEKRTFSQRYSGFEPDLGTQGYIAASTEPEETPSAFEAIAEDAAGTVREKLKSDVDVALLADSVKGRLIVGGQPTAPAAVRRRPAPQDCPQESTGDQIQPLRPNDVRSTSPTNNVGCL